MHTSSQFPIRPLARAVFVLAALAVSLAFAPGASRAAIPATNDHHYATRPTISGEVVSVGERSLAVTTDQGEDLTLAMDSHTMVPADLAPGMAMRAEFQVTEDGTLVAKRIVPIREGARRDRELAYSHIGESEQAPALLASTESHATEVDRDGNGVWGHPAMRTGPVTAVPATHAYRIATEPAVTGRVVAVNDHRMIVDTEDGARVTLAMDSRTLIPTDLAPGMTTRTEFKVMTDGSYYARRVTPTEHEVWMGRETAMREEENGEREEAEHGAYASTASNGHGGVVAQNAEQTSSGTQPEAEDETREDADQSGARLPQTASQQPLMALIGFGALAAAGALAYARRRLAS